MERNEEGGAHPGVRPRILQPRLEIDMSDDIDTDTDDDTDIRGKDITPAFYLQHLLEVLDGPGMYLVVSENGGRTLRIKGLQGNRQAYYSEGAEPYHLRQVGETGNVWKAYVDITEQGVEDEDPYELPHPEEGGPWQTPHPGPLTWMGASRLLVLEMLGARIETIEGMAESVWNDEADFHRRMEKDD